MKVDIGPYRNRINCHVYDRWENFRYPNNVFDDFDATKLDNFIFKLDDIIQGFYDATINKLLDKRERRVNVVIDHYDVFNADHTISLVIVPLLEEMINSKHGAPKVDDEDVPEELRTTNATPMTEEQKNCGGVDDLLFDRWDWVLKEMLWSFERIKNDDDWLNENKETMKENDKRCSHGLYLFGKYFRSLWT